ncbi:STE20 serine/threonine-protein kinase isoform X2, partial [Biomphalaria glabrata]
VKKKGELWIEEKETSTFVEMKQFITEKTSEILKRCTSVTSEQTKELDVPALSVEKGDKDDASSKTVTEISTLSSKDTVYLQLTEKVNEIDSNFSLQSEKFKKLQQKLKDQQTIIKRQEDTIQKLFNDFEKENNSKISETHNTFNERFQEIRVEFMTELQAASSFISQQQTQWETFCLELKKKQEKDKEHKELDVSTKFEELFEKQKELSKKLENSLKIQESQAKDFEDRNNSTKEIVKMKDDQGKLFFKIRNVQMEITRGREKEFFCEKTCQSDVKCIKNCLHIIGQHDQQISEGGQDYLHGYLDECLRHPGHLDFIPVDTLGLEHLPEDIRDKDLYDLIKAVADLTVRVNVTMTSPLRPMFWSDTKTPYSLYNMRGSQELRTGNGMVQNVVKILAETCPCQKCQLSGDPKPNYWSVGVGTVVSLVYDNIEASHTTCRFFYDTEYSSEIVLKVEDKNVYKSVENDLSFFYCSTCDETLVDKLEKSLKQLSRLQEWLDLKYRKTRDGHKLMFLVSHPHGCSKRVCLGQWKDKYTKSVFITKYTYLTSICPGCSGAPVYFLGDRRYYHSGSLNSGLGYNTNG